MSSSINSTGSNLPLFYDALNKAGIEIIKISCEKHVKNYSKLYPHLPKGYAQADASFSSLAEGSTQTVMALNTTFVKISLLEKQELIPLLTRLYHENCPECIEDLYNAGASLYKNDILTALYYFSVAYELGINHSHNSSFENLKENFHQTLKEASLKEKYIDLYLFLKKLSLTQTKKLLKEDAYQGLEALNTIFSSSLLELEEHHILDTLALEILTQKSEDFFRDTDSTSEKLKELAVENGFVQSARKLLENSNLEENQSLFLAARGLLATCKTKQQDYIDIIIWLINEKKLNFSQPLPNEEYLIHLVCQAECEPLIEFLIEKDPTLALHANHRGLFPHEILRSTDLGSAYHLVLDAFIIQTITSQYRKEDKLVRNRAFKAEPLLIADCFVNLSITPLKEQQQNEKEQLKMLETRQETENSFTEILKLDEKKLLSPDQMFKSCEGSASPRRIVCVGRPGIGKSTLCQYLTFQWASQSEEVSFLREKFRLIIKLQLRKHTLKLHQKVETISYGEVIKKEYFTTEILRGKVTGEDIEKSLLRLGNEKILFLLDGYDELPENSPANHAVRLILNPACQFKVLLTTRPYVNLKEFRFDLMAECMGFQKEQIEKYVSNACTETKAEKILQFLKKNHSILSLAYVPLLLDMICLTWDGELEKADSDFTMTDLYRHLNKKLMLIYGKKLEANSPNLERKALTAYLNTYETEIKQFLKEIAFLAMERNLILIDAKTVEKLIKNIFKIGEMALEGKKRELLEGGFLNCHYSEISHEEVYYFPHLTLQEYWAGIYLAERVKKIERDEGVNNERVLTQTLIFRLKNHPRFEMVLAFAAGILGRHSSLKPIKQFFIFLEKAPKSLWGEKNLQIFLICLEEAKFSLIQFKIDFPVLYKDIKVKLLKICMLRDNTHAVERCFSHKRVIEEFRVGERMMEVFLSSSEGNSFGASLVYPESFFHYSQEDCLRSSEESFGSSRESEPFRENEFSIAILSQRLGDLICMGGKFPQLYSKPLEFLIKKNGIYSLLGVKTLMNILEKDFLEIIPLDGIKVVLDWCFSYECEHFSVIENSAEEIFIRLIKLVKKKKKSLTFMREKIISYFKKAPILFIKDTAPTLFKSKVFPDTLQLARELIIHSQNEEKYSLLALHFFSHIQIVLSQSEILELIKQLVLILKDNCKNPVFHQILLICVKMYLEKVEVNENFSLGLIQCIIDLLNSKDVSTEYSDPCSSVIFTCYQIFLEILNSFFKKKEHFPAGFLDNLDTSFLTVYRLLTDKQLATFTIPKTYLSPKLFPPECQEHFSEEEADILRSLLQDDNRSVFLKIWAIWKIGNTVQENRLLPQESLNILIEILNIERLRSPPIFIDLAEDVGVLILRAIRHNMQVSEKTQEKVLNGVRQTHFIYLYEKVVGFFIENCLYSDYLISWLTEILTNLQSHQSTFETEIFSNNLRAVAAAGLAKIFTQKTDFPEKSLNAVELWMKKQIREESVGDVNWSYYIDNAIYSIGKTKILVSLIRESVDKLNSGPLLKAELEFLCEMANIGHVFSESDFLNFNKALNQYNSEIFCQVCLILKNILNGVNILPNTTLRILESSLFYGRSVLLEALSILQLIEEKNQLILNDELDEILVSLLVYINFNVMSGWQFSLATLAKTPLSKLISSLKETASGLSAFKKLLDEKPIHVERWELYDLLNSSVWYAFYVRITRKKILSEHLVKTLLLLAQIDKEIESDETIDTLPLPEELLKFICQSEERYKTSPPLYSKIISTHLCSRRQIFDILGNLDCSSYIHVFNSEDFLVKDLMRSFQSTPLKNILHFSQLSWSYVSKIIVKRLSSNCYIEEDFLCYYEQGKLERVQLNSERLQDIRQAMASKDPLNKVEVWKNDNI